MLTIIVDENLHETSPLMEIFRKSPLGRKDGVVVAFLNELHPGIPDVEILTKILNEQTILVTMDCVLHMQALARGFRSFTLDSQGDLTERPLAGVPLKSVPQSTHKRLQESYHPEQNPLASAMKQGLTEKKIEAYRTARRRIRSHFGSASAISAVSITIGCTPTARGMLSGFAFNLEGTSGVKGLRGREGYYLAEPALDDPTLPLLTALRDVFLLQLDQVRASLYIMNEQVLQLCREVQAMTNAPQPELHHWLWVMLRSKPALSVLPCSKGPFHDAMRSKLRSLQSLASNEIQMLNYGEIADRVLG